MEPRGGGHGPGGGRTPGGGRGRLRVAGPNPATRRLLAPVLHRGRGRPGQARRQHRRLRRHRRVASLAALRRRRVPGRDVAGGAARPRLRARLADPPGRDLVGPTRRRHPLAVRAAHRIVVDQPQPAVRPGRCPSGGRGTAQLGAGPGPAGAHHPQFRPSGVRAQGSLGHGLVLPGAGWGGCAGPRPGTVWRRGARCSSTRARACAASATRTG